MKTKKKLTGNSRYSLPPVRKGALYCSPWCGCGCTWADFQKATKAAKELCAKLGPKWKPHVWENGGRWHWQADLIGHNTSGTRVFVSGPSWKHEMDYWCEVNASYQQFIVHHKDPVKGIRAAILAAEKQAKQITDLAEKAAKSLR